MKTKTSVAKKTASFVAGGALLASLYANAVFVPHNQEAIVQNVDSQIHAVVSGKAEFAAEADGFKVVELAAKQKTDVRRLAAEIEKLQADIEDHEKPAAIAVAKVEPGSDGEVVRAAYQPEEVERTAQTFSQITSAAAQISSISGLPIGATIGSLASILADPLLSAGAVEVVTASTQPGGIAAAISAGGGLSTQATAVLALLGVQNVGGVGGGASAANAGGLSARQSTTSASSSTGGNISP